MNNTITITSPSQQISESIREAFTNIGKFQKASLNARKYADLASSLDTTSINDSLKKAIDFRSSFNNETFTADIKEALRITNSDSFKQITQSLNLSQSINIAKAFSLQSVISQPIVAPVDLPAVDSEDFKEIQDDYIDFIYQESKPSVYPMTLKDKLSLHVDTIKKSQMYDSATTIFTTTARFFFSRYLENQLPKTIYSVFILLILDIAFSFYDSHQNKKKDTN